MKTLKFPKLIISGNVWKDVSYSLSALFVASGIAVAQPTVPNTQSLPYGYDFGSTHITDVSLSNVGIQLSRYSAASPRYRATALELTTIPDANFANRAIQWEFDPTTRATNLSTAHTFGGLGPESYLNGTNASLAFSLGARAFQAVMVLTTSGLQNIKVVYKNELIENYSTTTGFATENVGMVLQYKVGTSGNWATVPNTAFDINANVNTTLGFAKTITGTLPAAANDQPLVQIRWITYQDFATLVDEYLTLGLDDIKISAQPKPIDLYAGRTVLYKEDFESSTKAVLAPNGNLPALPSNMKIYNVDGNSSDDYTRYGTDAFVVERRGQVGYIGKKTDNDGNTYYFNNANSAFPDSNYIAFATSFFSTTQTVGANRWLVTPMISISGTDLKLSFQAMSFTSSGNYKDSFKVYYSLITPGTNLIAGNWIAVPGTTTYEAKTIPENYTITLSSGFNNKNVAFAWQLNTQQPSSPDWGGDRLALDNIAITAASLTTGIEDADAEFTSLNVYPNPAIESILINSSEVLDVKVYNLSGAEVMTGKTGIPISILSLPKGLYIAVTKNGSVKFIVE